MMLKIARISRLAICLLLLSSLCFNFQTVSAGISAWSPEPIPSTTNNLLGPVGVDIRDLAFFNYGEIIYAAPGETVPNTIYRSTDGGNTWTTLAVPITTDLVAPMPDNDQVLAIANKTTPAVYLSIDGGVTWQDMSGIIGFTASAIDAIAISPQREGLNYLAVAGEETVGGNSIANMWYFELGMTMSITWHETNTLLGFESANETAALAFSPTFPGDGTAAFVTSNSSDVSLQLFNFGSKVWNISANYTGYPCTIVSVPGIDHLNSASLALQPDYVGYDPSARNLFIGLTVDGSASANATSGIYRLVDTTRGTVCYNTSINSVAFDGFALVAGAYDSNIVYSCGNPYDPIPIIQRSDTLKSPGGEGKVLVAWMQGTVVAGTSGHESAFAISEDNGFSFNDISLIDTTIKNAEDVAVAEEGAKIYLVTDNGTNLSVWRFAGTWWRVLSKPNSLSDKYIVRIVSNNDSYSDNVYIAKKGGNAIYYSDTGGTAHWQSITCSLQVQDLAVESPEVIYVINETEGLVAFSTNGGAFWNYANSHLGSGATITSVSPGIVLAGSTDGFVAYSFNGGITWTNIPQQIELGALNVQVVADEDFADNQMIYAASDAPGGSIYSYIIGSNESWTDIFDGSISGGVYGLVITNDVIYALEYNSANETSTLWRHLSPATIPPNSTEWTSSTIAADGQPVMLNATPQALKFTTSKLWAVRTNGTVNKFYSYYDPAANIKPILLNPIDSYIANINSLNTYPPDINFSWEQASVSTNYEFVLSENEDFSFMVTTVNVTSSDNVVNVTIGPYQSGAKEVMYTPATTYYWKVRATAPAYTSYSETRHFAISSLPPAAVEPVKLIPANLTSLVNPSFAWWPMSNITKYQFVLSDNPDMNSPLIDSNITEPSIQTNITLEYGKYYFWRVRPIEPMVCTWSAVSSFMLTGPTTTQTVMVTEAAQTVYVPYFISLMSTPGYLVGGVTIGLILIGVVLVLLFNHRNVNISRGTHMKPQLKLDHYTELPVMPITAEVSQKLPTATEADKGGPDIIQSAKHFLWSVTQQEEVTALGQREANEKGHASIGKKLANKIHDLAKKVVLYVNYPEDAAMLLAIWAEYRSKKETSSYLLKSFEANPYNAVKLIKCYLPTAHLGDYAANIRDFDIKKYELIAQVVDTAKMYEALTNLFKFKAQEIEDIVPVTPLDADLAHKFMRLHISSKSQP